MKLRAVRREPGARAGGARGCECVHACGGIPLNPENGLPHPPFPGFIPIPPSPPGLQGWYAESFADFRTFPAIKDNMDVVRFTHMLTNAFRRHNNVVPAIAKGVEVYKRELDVSGAG